MSWVIDNKINTHNLLPHNPTKQNASPNASVSSGGHTFTDKCCTKGACTEKNINTTNEVDTPPCAATTEKPNHGDTCTSDDDFMPAKVKKQSCTDKKPVSSDSEDRMTR